MWIYTSTSPPPRILKASYKAYACKCWNDVVIVVVIVVIVVVVVVVVIVTVAVVDW
jgi:hypothetical protein